LRAKDIDAHATLAVNGCGSGGGGGGDDAQLWTELSWSALQGRVIGTGETFYAVLLSRAPLGLLRDTLMQPHRVGAVAAAAAAPEPSTTTTLYLALGGGGGGARYFQKNEGKDGFVKAALGFGAKQLKNYKAMLKKRKQEAKETQQW